MSAHRPVVMLTNAIAPDKLGGLERYVRELSAALVAKGVSVTVVAKQIAPEDPLEELGGDGVRIVRHRTPSKRDPTFAIRTPMAVARGVRSEVRRAGPRAIIHGHYTISTLPIALGKRPYLYTFHAPVHKEILLEHGGSYFLPQGVQQVGVAAVRQAERRVVAHAERLATLSAFMRAEVEELDRSASLRTEVIPGGIDTTWFSPGSASRDGWAAPAAPLIFAARRLVRRTGVFELVGAMPAVLAAHPSARLALAGDGHERPAIVAEIARLGLGASVRLLGRVSDEELLRWYRVADLTVTPTQQLEGFGLSTGESLAVGTPALVTPVGSNAEVVRDLHPYLVAPGTESKDLADGLLRLLAEEGLLSSLATRARAQAHPRWSWEGVADRYLELYAAMDES